LQKIAARHSSIAMGFIRSALNKSLSEALAPPLFDSSILLVVWWTFLVLSYHLLISTVFLAVNSFEEQHPTAIVADY
jgi:hypothetical protein